jgi:hypothetical protein
MAAIFEAGSGAFQISERRSALGKAGIDRLLKSARIIPNRRRQRNSSGDSFEQDWPQSSSRVQSRLEAKMHIGCTH